MDITGSYDEQEKHLEYDTADFKRRQAEFFKFHSRHETHVARHRTGDLYEEAVAELEVNAAFITGKTIKMNHKRDDLMEANEKLVSLKRARK